MTHTTPAGSEEEVSAIFLRAAALMHKGADWWIDGACLAIESAAPFHQRRRALSIFEDLLRPVGPRIAWDPYWMGAPQPKYRPEGPEAQHTRELRVYALLLAAEASRATSPPTLRDDGGKR